MSEPNDDLTDDLDSLEKQLDEINVDDLLFDPVETVSIIPEPVAHNPVLPKGYEGIVIEKIKTFPATRCYGCNRVLNPNNILTDFFIASQTGGIAPYKCPDDNRVSWVHNSFV